MKYVLHKEDALEIKLGPPHRTAYIWIDKDTGAKNLALGTNEIEPESEFPLHKHEIEEEVMFIYSGKGIAVIEDVEYILEPETLVYIPPGIIHQFKNPGKEKLIFLWAFGPPGPEQNLKKK